MRVFTGLILPALMLACGQPNGGSLTLNFPAELVGDGFLLGGVFDQGKCSTLQTPVDFDTATRSVTHNADFDSDNRHPMTLTSIPAGSDRMVVVVIERDGNQVCQACADGIRIEDGQQASVHLVLENCP